MKKYFLRFALFFLCDLCLAQTINIPNANFKAKLLAANTTNSIARDANFNNIKIDTNDDGEIQVNEALTVYLLSLNGSNISSLSGIENFTNLINLNCEINQLTILNIGALVNLQTLGCSNNQLTTLDVSALSNLHFLTCRNNQLSSINLGTISGITSGIDCQNNQLTNLDLSNLTNIQNLFCGTNQLSVLNLNGLNAISYLTCNNNQLTSLDVNHLSGLQSLNCKNNALTSLYIKNGVAENTLDFSGNPALQYICADENQISAVQNLITTYGYTNCHTNSYCSFTPGGTFYTIQGSTRYDGNSNGCDVNDSFFPNFKLVFSNGTNSGNLICDTSGNYDFDVQLGTHTLNPILENPSYFTVSPTSTTVTFPTATSPFTQDFCITPNGVHNDLEVTILPLNAARPGFDSNYKISYKNKGTNTQSGNVNLTFDNAVLDFVTATPSFTSQITNSLAWSFTNLAPFETREILVTLNVNSQTETPAVNSGDVLNYTAMISGLTDETPIDNTTTLNQTVINSLDPNDKTCLEGAAITPSMVGAYVHYIIRFENNGTANAENIVVMDRIDVSKFDISSLMPISSSHSFITKITDTNKVEFIFENINLPFDNATNDGYVAFKIKTKPTLVVGDTFSNAANIYFDYNFPIVTNTAITLIQALGAPDFEFDTYFTLAPNPAKEVLNIQVKDHVQISSVSLYNTLGQLVLIVTEPTSTIDVSSLKVGNYFIKVVTDKGSSSSTFIKE